MEEVGALTPGNMFPALAYPLTRDDLKHIGVALGFLIATVIVSRFLSSRLRAALVAGGFQANVAILLARTLWVAVWTVGLLLVFYQLGGGLTPLTAFVGIVGLAATLSLQQVLQNLVAGVYLLAERPFNIGDIIAVVGNSGLNHEGTVLDIEMRTTHLRSREGEVILVPNSLIFSGVVTNRTAIGGYATQISVTFPRQTDPAGVRDGVASVLANLPNVLPAPAPALRIDKAESDTWTARVLLWIRSSDAGSDAIWAIASAFPEATVNDTVGVVS